jgi:hypothetical protein
MKGSQFLDWANFEKMLTLVSLLFSCGLVKFVNLSHCERNIFDWAIVKVAIWYIFKTKIPIWVHF